MLKRPLRGLTAALAALVIAVFALAPFAGGQALPELGDSSAGTLSPQLERRIGEEAFREIRARDPKYLDDPELAQYVTELGQRLVAASADYRQPYEFFVLRDPSVNAFAMPGGFVGVHTGLIAAAQSESEIASVLAHEIVHVTQHHIARMANQQSQISAVSTAAFVLALLAARSSPDIAQAAISSAAAGSIQLQLNYSRDFEREADRLGFQLMRDAGFDVHAVAAFFERLQKSVRLHETNFPAYLRTHPVTVERISDMQNRAHGVPYRQTSDSLSFHLVRAKLRADTGAARDAVALAESQLRERRYASEAGARYALAAALTRAGDIARATREFAALRAQGADHPMIDLLGARLRAAARDPRAALQLLRASAARHRDYRPLQYAYVEALQAVGAHDEALAELSDAIERRPADPRLHGMQARSHAGKGRSLLQHRALAEQYYHMGALSAAIEQLQLAQRSKDGDFYQMSAVDARLRELRAEMAERARK
jgi:beta-barrel assembly-enhancing protease